MRKVSKLAAQAFAELKNFSRGGTRTVSYNGYSHLFLHDNPIAIKNGDVVKISTCGWHTRTTFDRLNAIEGVHVCKVKGVTHLNGKPWHGRAVNLAEWNASK